MLVITLCLDTEILLRKYSQDCSRRAVLILPSDSYVFLGLYNKYSMIK